MTDLNSTSELRRTPLYALHLRLGARMVAFAGYELPVQYPSGIIKEHLHTRAAVSVFDISHMGQIALRPRSGNLPQAAHALERLVPADILGLPVGRQRYTMFTNPTGGVLDDLMVSNLGDHLRLVVNASRRADDEAHLRLHLSEDCLIEPLRDQALVALQGPKAEAVLATFIPEIRIMKFMDVRAATLLDNKCIVSRSGYTGEDGFEIGIPAGCAEALYTTLLRNPDLAPAGLGARDGLRLESGLCLYGSDLNETTTPVEAVLEWTITRARRAGGERPGGFPGAERILEQLANGTARRRVGLRPQGRAMVRGGAPLFREQMDTDQIGTATSGGFAASLNAPAAMGYVPCAFASPGVQLFAEVRGKRHQVVVSTLPFVPTRYRH